jgi:CPA2 family monovalent cation:H+ antiporter-2
VEAPAFLEDLLVLVGAAALIAYVSQRLRLAPAAGFLVAGIAIGPNALGLVRSTELIDSAAELGVLLLLFTIGIEFSLESLSRIRRAVLLGGSLQVLITVALVTVVLRALGVGWASGIFTGFLAALSSTAIVLNLLSDRGEMKTPLGSTALAILVFQDLAVLAMILLVPALAGEGGPGEVLLALGKAVVFIALVLVVARRVMPRLLEAVARTCSTEVFLLTVLGICVGSAYLFSRAGVSLSLGAFLAGLLVSESPFSGHALGEILPLKILFSAAFFVSVGLLVDIRFVLENLLAVAVLVVAVVAIKTVSAAAAVASLGHSASFSLGAALTLAQVGEFSFVLEDAGRDVGLLAGGLATGSQVFVAVTVLLMLLSPGLYAAGRSMVLRSGPLALRAGGAVGEAGGAAPKPRPAGAIGRRATGRSGHVILAGYGAVARRVVPVLQAAGAEIVVATLSPEGAREAEALGLTVLRGDYGKRHLLDEADLAGAAALVIADDDLDRTRAVAGVARQLEPDALIIGRGRNAAEAEALLAAGAHTALADDVESAATIAERVLEALMVDAARSDALVSELQTAAYRKAVGGKRAAALRASFELTSQERQSRRCRHTGQATVVVPGSQGCAECLRDGYDWVHLRICMTCGHVGCCDTSPHRHARAHWNESGHPLMKSAEPGEDWAWCYIDEAVL